MFPLLLGLLSVVSSLETEANLAHSELAYFQSCKMAKVSTEHVLRLGFLKMVRMMTPK